MRVGIEPAHSGSLCSCPLSRVSRLDFFFNRENVTTIKGISEALSFVETDVELAMTEMTDSGQTLQTPRNGNSDTRPRDNTVSI